MKTKTSIYRSIFAFAYVLLVAVIFCGCENGKNGANGDKIPLGNKTIQTIEYDNCEYIYLRRYGSVTISHKGNCKFCAERSKK